MSTTPIATVLCEEKALSFTYFIDTGAEVSIIKHFVIIALNGIIKPSRETLSFVGVGNQIVYLIGVCELIFVLTAITLEIDFVVVSDKVIPGELDIIIGWDIINHPFVQILKTSTGLELQYQPYNIQRILVGQCVPEIMINQLHLDTDLKVCLEKLLVKFKSKTPDHILTGKMTIRLKGSTPVV